MGLGTPVVWPTTPQPAVCTARVVVAGRDAHQPPVKGCTCGYWAVQGTDTLSQTVTMYRSQVKVVGAVVMSGTIIRHQRGLRAAMARPVVLCPVERGVMSDEAFLALCARYEVGVHLLPEGAIRDQDRYGLEALAGEFGDSIDQAHARYYIPPHPELCACNDCQMQRWQRHHQELMAGLNAVGASVDSLASAVLRMVDPPLPRRPPPPAAAACRSRLCIGVRATCWSCCAPPLVARSPWRSMP